MDRRTFRRIDSRTLDRLQAEHWARKRADAADLEARLASGALVEGGGLARLG